MTDPRDLVDEYGNTERGGTIYCCFPDCGCNGAQHCTAKNGASERAGAGNVEGMWSGKTRRQREAAFALIHEVHKP